MDISGIKDEVKETQRLQGITNGKVRKHEWYFKALWWGLGALVGVCTIVFPMVWRAMKQEIKNISMESVREILSEYEVEVHE